VRVRSVNRHFLNIQILACTFSAAQRQDYKEPPAGMCQGLANRCKKL
jgi:hypothetical protein